MEDIKPKGKQASGTVIFGFRKCLKRHRLTSRKIFIFRARLGFHQLCGSFGPIREVARQPVEIWQFKDESTLFKPTDEATA
jgi:hypothetical protein